MKSISARFASSVLAASAGAAIGLGYAKTFVAAELLERGHLPGVYAAAGAAMAVLLLRLGQLIHGIVRDYRKE